MAIDPLTAGLSLVDTIISRVFPDPVDQDKARVALLEMQQKGDLAQIGVNTAEAANENLFVSGWRPFIGWTCGGAFAFNFVVAPLIAYTAALTGHPVPLPDIDMGALIGVLGGMLGLGGLRTFEKYTGTNKNR